MTSRDVTHQEAKRIAKKYKVDLPRVGYEMSLGEGRWIRSTGHFQFGWFDKPEGMLPFSIVCRCNETLRPGEPRGCPKTCPNAPKEGS